MANTFTPTDVYSIVNAMSTEMYGDNASISAFDTSSFVSVGEHMLRTGYTNTLDALGHVLAPRTTFSSRPYNGVFNVIVKLPKEWGGIERKISFYATKNEPTQSFNTDLNATQLVDGASVDPWTISKVYPLEISFCGVKVLQKSYTRWIDQLRGAFSSPDAFSEYVGAMLVNIANDIQVAYDAQNRLQVLNAIGATLNVGNTRQAVNMTSRYNAFYGTSKTTADLLGADFESFMEFFVMCLEGDMELAKEYNDLFHIFPARNDDSGNALTLLRHTPADMRRLILYMPIIRQAEKTVFPALFDSSLLRISDYSGVEYWQNPNDAMAIDIVPNQLDVVTGQAVTGNRVQEDHILGIFFDRDAIATSIQIEDVYTSDVNPRGKYINQVYHWGFRHKLDQTENIIVYYMAD